jgi:hypothetical protein
LLVVVFSCSFSLLLLSSNLSSPEILSFILRLAASSFVSRA